MLALIFSAGFAALLANDLITETCTYHESRLERLLHAYVGHVPRQWILLIYGFSWLVLFLQGLAQLMKVWRGVGLVFVWIVLLGSVCKQREIKEQHMVRIRQPRVVPYNAAHLRVLPFNNIFNFRDCGGYVTLDKKHRVRWGRCVYRFNVVLFSSKIGFCDLNLSVSVRGVPPLCFFRMRRPTAPKVYIARAISSRLRLEARTKRRSGCSSSTRSSICEQTRCVVKPSVSTRVVCLA